MKNKTYYPVYAFFVVSLILYITRSFYVRYLQKPKVKTRATKIKKRTPLNLTKEKVLTVIESYLNEIKKMLKRLPGDNYFEKRVIQCYKISLGTIEPCMTAHEKYNTNDITDIIKGCTKGIITSSPISFEFKDKKQSKTFNKNINIILNLIINDLPNNEISKQSKITLDLIAAPAKKQCIII